MALLQFNFYETSTIKMIILYRKVLYVAIAILLTGCIQNNSIGKIDLDPVVKSKIIATNKNEPLKINICDEVPLKWDNVIVIPPYTSEESIRELKLENAGTLAKEISKIYLDEGICTLAFIHRGNVVKLSTVSRQLIDMANVATGKDYLVILPKTRFCENLYSKRESGNRMVAYLKP